MLAPPENATKLDYTRAVESSSVVQRGAGWSECLQQGAGMDEWVEQTGVLKLLEAMPVLFLVQDIPGFDDFGRISAVSNLAQKGCLHVLQGQEREQALVSIRETSAARSTSRINESERLFKSAEQLRRQRKRAGRARQS